MLLVLFCSLCRVYCILYRESILLCLRIPQIDSCHEKGHGPFFCGREKCPFSKLTEPKSREYEIKEKLDKIASFCYRVYSAGPDKLSTTTKRTIIKSIKKLKNLIGMG